MLTSASSVELCTGSSHTYFAHGSIFLTVTLSKVERVTVNPEQTLPCGRGVEWVDFLLAHKDGSSLFEKSKYPLIEIRGPTCNFLELGLVFQLVLQLDS